jgi:hypothetical protein
MANEPNNMIYECMNKFSYELLPNQKIASDYNV